MDGAAVLEAHAGRGNQVTGGNSVKPHRRGDVSVQPITKCPTTAVEGNLLSRENLWPGRLAAVSAPHTALRWGSGSGHSRVGLRRSRGI